MKFLIFADLHNEPVSLKPSDADAILLVGDIYWKTVHKIDQFYTQPKFGVLGNHDREDTFDGTSIVNLHLKAHNFNGITLAGFQGAKKYNARGFGQYTDIDAKKKLQTLRNEKIDLFLSHSNPDSDAFESFSDTHEGFYSLTEFLREKKIPYHFHGHLHEELTYKLEETTVHSIYGVKTFTLDF